MQPGTHNIMKLKESSVKLVALFVLSDITSIMLGVIGLGVYWFLPLTVPLYMYLVRKRPIKKLLRTCVVAAVWLMVTPLLGIAFSFFTGVMLEDMGFGAVSGMIVIVGVVASVGFIRGASLALTLSESVPEFSK